MNIHAARIALPPAAEENGAARPPFVLALRGFVCDRYTQAAMQGASLLARAAAGRLHAPLRALGRPSPAENISWRESLGKAAPYLRHVEYFTGLLLRRSFRPFIFANRCGASIATIRAMLRYRPEAKIVWFDAHGDFNTPATSPSGYLGGMVLSALCGLWNSGFDAGLAPERIILSGTRDLDPGEAKLIAAHGVKLIAARDGTINTSELIEAIGGAPVWLHIDTDVIDPLYLPAEYRVAQGVRPSALHAVLRKIVRASEIIGLELTEFEAPGNPGQSARAVRTIMRMIEPVLAAYHGQRLRPSGHGQTAMQPA
ncbi:MAG: arginase family protein [Beijerinckiaceae bacterium]|nr:arginase family protein [Beijerinckiaceae bacterium]